MNPQMMQYGPGYPQPQQQPLTAQMQGMSLNQPPGMISPGMAMNQAPGMTSAGMPFNQGPGMPLNQQSGMPINQAPGLTSPGMPLSQPHGVTSPGMPPSTQDPYRRPQQVSNGSPGGGMITPQINGPPNSAAPHQNYRPPNSAAPAPGYNGPQGYPPGLPATQQQIHPPGGKPGPGPGPQQAFPPASIKPQPGYPSPQPPGPTPNQNTYHPGPPRPLGGAPTAHAQNLPPNPAQGLPPSQGYPKPGPPTNPGMAPQSFNQPPLAGQQIRPQGFPSPGAPPSSYNTPQQAAQSPQPNYGPPPAGYPPQGPQGYPPPPNAAGYPPQPGGYYPPQPGPPGPDQYGQQKPAYPQQVSAPRIEPDQLPSVIQVMQEDEKQHAGVFCTNQKGAMPPLMTTNFTVQDGGHCSPRFVRSTLYNVPITTDMMKQTAVPFALCISPLARLAEGEMAPPVVDMGEIGPVRCVRCKAYMSPFMQFLDGGRRFQCLLCKATTEVPPEYFQHLDHDGLRTDRFQRPELILGAYEFVCDKEYCRNSVKPQPPALVFILDVSYNNVRNGLVQLMCARMKEVLSTVPRGQRVGFITYGSSVHFYNIKSSLAAPQMVIVGDVHEMFMPLLDGFLADPVESEAVIDQLMEEIPRQFADTRETETILKPAIQAGLEALKAADCAGKLLVFQSSLPTMEAPGKLKNRDDRKLLGGDKEKTVLAPQNREYNDLGQDCVQAGVGVDLFVFNNSYIDLATIGQVSRMTGGEVFKYTYFQADIDGDRFIEDLKMDVSRETAYDAIMRVRTSTGTRPTDFYGHMFMQNTTDVELACIDSDKAVAIEIKHDDKLTEEDGVYIQVALLYTHVTGQRRLRVLNLGLKACSQMADMYRCADLDTVINYYAKQGVTKLLELTPKQVKENLMTRCATTLACYRKNCASPSSMGQLILPECLKLLPLYVNTLMKSDALAGGSDMTVDDRSFTMYAVSVMNVNLSIVYFYPRLVPLHLNNSSPIRCSIGRLKEDGIYLLDNGIHMFLWLGQSVRPDLITSLFNVGNTAQVNSDRPVLPELDNPFSHGVRQLIDETRRSRHRHMRLTIVKQGDKLEMVMKHFLMEDSGVDGSPSYVDFLCHMHKEIRTMLS